MFETEFMLNDLMNDLFSFISAEKMVKHISEVDLKLDLFFENEDSIIFADQAKIKQILTNLIGNAVKFTTRGSIAFGYRLKDKDTLEFYVKDSGIGIKEDKQGVIFVRFMQADQSLARPYSGSGLGLAISRGFVERMGGQIWFESEYGKGSTFYFTVPYKGVKSKNKKQSKEADIISGFDWKDLTILIVEDNLVSYKLLEISLSKTGCKVLHADNGVDAVEMAVNNPEIDIVLMDIQLPHMNGYDATRAIKQKRPNLHIIAQTANAMDDDRLKCLEAGCSDYVTKPILLDKLLPVIEKFMTN